MKEEHKHDKGTVINGRYICICGKDVTYEEYESGFLAGQKAMVEQVKKDIGQLFNKCKTERGLSRALVNYLQTLEDNLNKS